MSIFRKKDDEKAPQVEVQGDDIIIQDHGDDDVGEGQHPSPKPKKVKMPPTKWA